MFLQILITIGASQALTLAMLLLTRRKKCAAEDWLAIKLILIFALTMLYNYRYELAAWWPGFPLNPLVLGYLVMPIFYFYIRSAAGYPVKLNDWRLAGHGLPFIAAFGLLQYTIAGMSTPMASLLVPCDPAACSEPGLQVVYFGFFLGIFPYYIYRSLRVLQQHEAYLLTKFSYTEDINLDWLNRFLWTIAGVWLCFIGFEVIGNGIFRMMGEMGFQISFLALLFSLVALGVYGFRRPQAVFAHEVAEEGAAAPANDAKYQNYRLPDDKARQFLRQLEDYMERERPYLEPKLTISELAQGAGLPVNTLSQILNDRLGQNFFDYVNGYRVAAFQELARSPKGAQYTLLGLAYEAGFNSKSTFNAIFKRATGQTPSEYVKSLRVNKALG